MHVLAVEPFFGGSHRAFLEGLVRHSRHRWTLVTGKPVHWKWRSRSAPLELAGVARERVLEFGNPDVVWASDMLDIPTWRGMLCGSRLCSTPTVFYFHENQWTYPISPAARTDFHFGYTNLLSAITADACWFNSAFHRDQFLAASESFIRRMPDTRAVHDLARLREKSDVVPPGFDPPRSLPPRHDRSPDDPIRIGWVSRWEYDKRPDRFLEIILQLQQLGCDFQLVLLGARPTETPQTLDRIRREFSQRLLHDGFAASSQQYWQRLQSMDVVVSTADHEFFGIAICEAIWAGAAPVLPRRLSYPEIVSEESLYGHTGHAASMIARLRDRVHRQQVLVRNQALIEKLKMEHTAKRIDDELEAVANRS